MCSEVWRYPYVPCTPEVRFIFVVCRIWEVWWGTAKCLTSVKSKLDPSCWILGYFQVTSRRVEIKDWNNHTCFCSIWPPILEVWRRWYVCLIKVITLNSAIDGLRFYSSQRVPFWRWLAWSVGQILEVRYMARLWFRVASKSIPLGILLVLCLNWSSPKKERKKSSRVANIGVGHAAFVEFRQITFPLRPQATTAVVNLKNVRKAWFEGDDNC